jgi:uncharacterized protein YjbI with pentapeptide repeats
MKKYYISLVSLINKFVVKFKRLLCNISSFVPTIIDTYVQFIAKMKVLFLCVVENTRSKKLLKRVALFFSIIIGYLTLYNLTYQRYEAYLNELKTSASFLIAKSDILDSVDFSRISQIQFTTTPFKPEIESPLSILKSYIKYFNNYDSTIYSEIQSLIRRVRGRLNNLKIDNIVFSIHPIHYIDIGNGSRDFRKSNFENSSLLNSGLEGLNLSYSNFSKALIYSSNMAGTELKYSNLKDCAINDVNMIRASLDFADISKSVLSDNNFFLASLVNVNLSNTVIERNNFQYSLLLGTDLSKVIMLNPNNFQNALYNSQDLNYEEHYFIIATFRELLKKIHADKNLIKACDIVLYKIHINNIIEQTIFSKDLNPQEHGMIDFFEIVKFIQTYKKEEVEKYVKNRKGRYYEYDQNLRMQEELDTNILNRSIRENNEAYKMLLETIQDVSL